MKILVVEADADARDAWTLLVTDLGHEAILATSGEEAAERFHGGEIDIVLADAGVVAAAPEEFLAFVHGVDDEIPVVFLVAQADADLRRRLLRAGAQEVVPRSPEEEAALALRRAESFRQMARKARGDRKEADTHIVQRRRLQDMVKEAADQRWLAQERQRRLQKTVAELQQKRSHLEALNEIAQKVNSKLKLTDMLESAVEVVGRALSLESFCLLLYDEEEDALKIRASRGFPKERIDEVSLRPGEGVSGQVFSRGLPFVTGDVRKEPDFTYYRGLKPEIRSYMSVPLLIPGGERMESIGVLSANSPEMDAFSPDDLDLVRAAAAVISLALQNAQVYEQARREAVTDGLTRLANHRRFQEVLREWIDRAEREEGALSLAMIDLDDFKPVNDTYGHSAGDQVLVRVARTLAASVRPTDFVARYGGEEFCILLPRTRREEAVRMAERVRQAVRRSHWEPTPREETSLQVTISVGVAEYPRDATTAGHLVQNADEALYRAKGEGKDRIEAYAADDASERASP